MKLLYRFVLSWIEFDLVVARSTGRNPRQIRQLEKEWGQYDSLIAKMEINK